MLVCIFFVLDRTSVAMAKASVFQKKSNYYGKTFSVYEPSSFRWVQHIDWPPSWQQDISQGLLTGWRWEIVKLGGQSKMGNIH